MMVAIRAVQTLGCFLMVAPGLVAADGTVAFHPPGVEQTTPFEERRARQLATSESLTVAHDFSFTDRQPGSGIEFVHRIVDDAGKHYKAAHYDHGNGLAVADYDGDGLTDIYLVSQVGANALYRNLGDGRFEDVTEPAGLALPDDIGVTASFADIDNDGDADLYVTNVRSPNRLFENRGDGSFRDITAVSGLGYSEHSSAAVFFDYDRDGLLDLFLAVVGEYTTDRRSSVSGTPPDESAGALGVQFYVAHQDAFAGHLKPERSRTSRLFRNLGNRRFEDVTETTGLVDDGWSGAALPIDLNTDGWPDLYVMNMQGHDSIWLNEGGARFVDQTATRWPKSPWGTMGGKVFDYNNDSYMDLLLTDMHSDMSQRIGMDREKLKADWITKNWAPSFLRSGGRSIFGNALYRNDGETGFREVSGETNVENYWPWGLSVGDLNADGWQDVFITASMNYPFRYAPNTVLLNHSGERFVDAEYILGVEPRRGGRLTKPWIVLDCHDGDSKHPHCTGIRGELIVHGALGSRASAVFDLDGDGDLDVVTNEFGDVPQVLLSDLAQRRGKALRYVKIALRGSRSNRDGLGAAVTVVDDRERRYAQTLDGQSGYLSQSSLPLYFGLGDAEAIRRVEVVWPSGARSELRENLKLNSVVDVVEPAG